MFLHRTVHDFLDTTEAKDALTQWQGENFNIHLALCQTYLAEIKSTDIVIPRVSRDEGSTPAFVRTFLVNLKTYEVSMKLPLVDYLDAFGQTVIQRANLDERDPETLWSTMSECRTLMQVMIKYDLLISVNIKLQDMGTPITKENKVQLLNSGVTRRRGEIRSSLSLAMTRLILPIGPPIQFDKNLQDILAY